MTLIVKNFSGRLSRDKHPFRVADQDFIDALNITRNSEGEFSDDVVSNINGNQLVSNSLPAGVCKGIGNYADMVRNRWYYVLWNSNGFNTLYYLDNNTNAIIKVFQNKTDSNGEDIWPLNPSFRINHINIIYTDKGDVLYLTDGINAPFTINVDRAVAGGYGTFRDSYIQVIKAPPIMPIKAVYQDDNSITVNNFRKKLFKLKYRYVYLDDEKSVCSAECELPLPINFLDTLLSGSPSLNSKISFVYQTGSPIVKKIEILCANSTGASFTDYYLIQTIDKIAQNIPNDDIAISTFYNDQAYTNIDITQSIQPYDFVPLIANTQDCPNGNVLTYVGITEGFNPATITGFTSNTTETPRTTQAPFVFVVNEYKNRFHAILIGSIAPISGVTSGGGTFTIITSNNTITYTASGGNTILDVINGLSASASGQGFTIISSDGNNLIFSKNNETLQRYDGIQAFMNPTDSFVYDFNSKYGFAIVEFDKYGRTPGATTNNQMSVQTNGNTLNNIPVINLQLSNRPSEWASYFHVVRTKNTSKLKILYWGTNITGKDSEYAYIGITNLTQFIQDNPGTTLSYTFSPGDRIRFIKLLPSGTVYTDKDFEILSEVATATVGGQQQTGTFLKIALPPTSGIFDFGSNAFYNYFIEIYTPAQPVANGLDVYYEFGEQYQILDAGTPNRRYQGNVQNQSADLSQPAIFKFDKGDDYLRNRKIPLGNVMHYTLTPSTTIRTFARIGCSFNYSTGNNSDYQIGSSSFAESPPLFAANNWLIKTGATAHTFRVKGILECKIDPSYPQKYETYFEYRISGGRVQLTPYTYLSGNNHFLFNVDVTFTMPPNEELYFFEHKETGTGGVELFLQEWTITDTNSSTQLVVDNSFSDFFPSLVNSNGRYWIVDTNAARTYYPTTMRFGQEYQQGTNINQINRFYYDNKDTYDRSFGDVKKIFIEGRRMYVFHQFEIGIVPILTQIVKDTAGNPLEANSDILLNKITYPYKGKYGIGNMPSSFVYGKGPIYFIDPNKGIPCRLSQDGITPLSILYGTNSFFIDKLMAYNINLNNGIAPSGQPYLGDPTVIGAYDAFTNKYILCMEEINRYSDPNTLIFHQDSYTIPFDEPSNSFEGFYSYKPDDIGCLNNLIISIKNGQLWTHDNEIYCNFYGTQYDSTITVVFNMGPLEKKTWMNITETANSIWDIPEITTQLNSYGQTPQSSLLLQSDFTEMEGQFHASFLQDINSTGGINSGDSLKGIYMIAKFRALQPSTFTYLNMVAVQYKSSPKSPQP